jgi:SAM-dependent methyltransferase
LEHLIQQQMAYYRARASEYDQWFLREGRYDRGPENRREWFAEIAQLERAVDENIHGGDVLELACGTGLWTARLTQNNPRIVAVDASPEVVSINRQRVGPANVEYHVANIFEWRPAETFDTVFFSFWLSHVPPQRFDEFWLLVKSALKPGGTAFFIDSLLEQSSAPRDHAPLSTSGIVRRKLNDGREFDIVKIFYEPVELEHNLFAAGWKGWIRSTGKFFFCGCVSAI